DLNTLGPKLKDDPGAFGSFLEKQAKAHLLPYIAIIDSKGTVLISTKQHWVPELGEVTPADIAQANQNKVVLLTEANDRFVSALVRLEAFVDAYLLVSRNVDPKVLEYQENTNAAVEEYNRLNQNRSDIQINFVVLYVVIALLILLAAVWLGLWAANRLVTPIGRLVGAAERVTEGDLSARVATGRSEDELGQLGHAFNRMTAQLESQRNALVDANRQLDARRRFTEAMLAGVSAGVVGLDGDGRVTLINRTAARLLNLAPEESEGRHYSECIPELAALIRRAMREGQPRTAGQVDVKRDGQLRHLNVQVSSEAGERQHGFVVTFDDISNLVSAQRTAAWADVARRIAHEIKNPLTPIQLSAERLKRKYAEEVASDPEVFKQCTDTIIRQVHDIGRMVDEFSSFARMPAPVIHTEAAQELVRQAVFLQRVASPQTSFEVNAPKDTIHFECDGRLVSQALTNVLKNAVEAIAARQEIGDDAPGRIGVAVAATPDRVVIAVRDNGVGLPREHRHRLTEPYVTTRAKGTGLGLAIVRKILEDHGGELTLEDSPDSAPGAVVRMAFPLRQRVKKQGLGHEAERVAGGM
ncbi:MAG: ATP-binding protein, partial [Alphaproteobacteria bacterium]